MFASSDRRRAADHRAEERSKPSDSKCVAWTSPQACAPTSTSSSTSEFALDNVDLPDLHLEVREMSFCHPPTRSCLHATHPACHTFAISFNGCIQLSCLESRKSRCRDPASHNREQLLAINFICVKPSILLHWWWISNSIPPSMSSSGTGVQQICASTARAIQTLRGKHLEEVLHGNARGGRPASALTVSIQLSSAVAGVRDAQCDLPAYSGKFSILCTNAARPAPHKGPEINPTVQQLCIHYGGDDGHSNHSDES